MAYHLLSLRHNRRLRIKVFLKHEPLIIPSVMEIWPAANWFEREAYDVIGIMFECDMMRQNSELFMKKWISSRAC